MSTITTNEVNKYSADQNAELEKAIKQFFEFQKIELKKALGVFFTNQNIALHNTFSKFFENGATEYELLPVKSINTNVVNQNIQSDATLCATPFGNSNAGFLNISNPNSSGGFGNPNYSPTRLPSFGSNPTGPSGCIFGSNSTRPPWEFGSNHTGPSGCAFGSNHTALFGCTLSSNPTGSSGFGSNPSRSSEKSNLSKRKEREEEDIKPTRKTRQKKK